MTGQFWCLSWPAMLVKILSFRQKKHFKALLYYMRLYLGVIHKWHHPPRGRGICQKVTLLSKFSKNGWRHLWEGLLVKKILTWAINTSPKGSKYSLSSGSVVFQGNPRTIRSEHLFFSTLLFLATQLSEWSSDFLLSAETWKK